MASNPRMIAPMMPSGARRRAMNSPITPTSAAMMIQMSSCGNVILIVGEPPREKRFEFRRLTLNSDFLRARCAYHRHDEVVSTPPHGEEGRNGAHALGLCFNRDLLLDNLFNCLFNPSASGLRSEGAHPSYPSESTYTQCTSSIETHTHDHARTNEQAHHCERDEKCFHSDLLLREGMAASVLVTAISSLSVSCSTSRTISLVTSRPTPTSCLTASSRYENHIFYTYDGCVSLHFCSSL